MLRVAPDDIDGHRLGLAAAQQERRELIVEKTKRLVDRMDKAGAIADSNVLLHVRKARAVVDSVNSAAVVVDEFHGPFGIETQRGSMEATRWWDAFRDRGQWKNAGAEAARETPKGLAIVGAAAVTITTVVKSIKKRGA